MSNELARQNKTILKLTFPLSSQPKYVEYENLNATLGEALRDAIDGFERKGDAHTAMQLSNAIESQALFMGDQRVSMNTPLSDLGLGSKTIAGQEIHYGEFTFLDEHRGGL